MMTNAYYIQAARECGLQRAVVWPYRGAPAYVDCDVVTSLFVAPSGTPRIVVDRDGRASTVARYDNYQRERERGEHTVCETELALTGA